MTTVIQPILIFQSEYPHRYFKKNAPPWIGAYTKLWTKATSAITAEEYVNEPKKAQQKNCIRGRLNQLIGTRYCSDVSDFT